MRRDLRLQLLEPEQHPSLIKALCGILMLLPQSPAFHTLKNRFKNVEECQELRDLVSVATEQSPVVSGP